MSKRIGMILDKAFPPDPRVQNEALTLVEAGFDVYLFCLSYNNEAAEEDFNGIKIKRYKSNTLEYKLSALTYTIPLYSWLMTKKIKHFLKSNAIEIIHIHDMRIAQAVFGANHKQLPTFLDLHDNFPEVMKLYPHLQKFPGKQLISPKKWKLKEEEFIRKASKVITVSPEFQSEVIERTQVSENKMVLVPNSVRPEFYNNVQTDTEIAKKFKNDFVILYLGDTALRRGLTTAIEAMPQIIEQVPNAKLVIVGSNTTDNVLKELVHKLNLTEVVVFEGWQHVKLFPSYILTSAVCISPLLRNKQHDVAYANKLFQYMSLGKPVVVSDAIAQKKVVEENRTGLVHINGDVDDFANQIVKLSRDEDLSKSLGQNGRDFIHHQFNWQITSKALVDAYNEF